MPPTKTPKGPAGGQRIPGWTGVRAAGSCHRSVACQRIAETRRASPGSTQSKIHSEYRKWGRRKSSQRFSLVAPGPYFSFTLPSSQSFALNPLIFFKIIHRTHSSWLLLTKGSWTLLKGSPLKMKEVRRRYVQERTILSDNASSSNFVCGVENSHSSTEMHCFHLTTQNIRFRSEGNGRGRNVPSMSHRQTDENAPR